MMFANIDSPYLIVVALLVVLLFGAKKLPEFARSIGQAKREFERGADSHDANPPVNPPAAEPTRADDIVTLTRADYDRLRGNPPSTPPKP